MTYPPARRRADAAQPLPSPGRPHGRVAPRAGRDRRIDGAADSVWAFAPMRLAPGLTLHRSLMAPRYDACGGPMVAQGATEDLLARMLAEPALAADGACCLPPTSWPRDPPGTPFLPWPPKAGDRDRSDGPVAEVPSRAQRGARRRCLSPAGHVALASEAHAPEEGSIERRAAVAADRAKRASRSGGVFDAFCTLEAAGWKGRAGTALAQDAPGRAYVRDVITAAAADGEAFTMLRCRATASSRRRCCCARAAKCCSGRPRTTRLSPAFAGRGARYDGHRVALRAAVVRAHGCGTRRFRRSGARALGGTAAMATVAIMLKPASLRGRLVVGLLKLRQALRAWRNRRQAAK